MGKQGQKVVVDYIAGCDKDAQDTVDKIKELGGDAVAIQADCSSVMVRARGASISIVGPRTWGPMLTQQSSSQS